MSAVAAESLKLGMVFGGMLSSMAVGVGTIMAIAETVDQRKKVQHCADFTVVIPRDYIGFQLCMERSFPREFEHARSTKTSLEK